MKNFDTSLGELAGKQKKGMEALEKLVSTEQVIGKMDP
jgi:hypothetical protein